MWTLIWKEFLTVLKDKKIRISLLLPPIIQLFVFTYAATLDVKNVSIGIFNQDGGTASAELMQRLQGNKIFSQITYLQGEEEIASFIDHQQGMMVLSIDEQFSRNLAAKKPANIQIILDGRKSNTTQIVAGYMNDIVSGFNQDVSLNIGVKQQNVQIVDRVWFNPNSLYFWYNIPCLVVVLSMLICLVITTQAVARERELGTFDQLLVSPLSAREILIGKMVPGIFIGFLEGMFMLTVGTLILRVPFTGFFPLYLVSILTFVTAVSGVGLFISSLSYTQQQAMLGTFIFMMPAILLSGYATPIENMPTWLQPVTSFNPLTYMLIISKGLFLKAMPAKTVFANLWPLSLIACFTITCSGILFRKKIA